MDYFLTGSGDFLESGWLPGNQWIIQDVSSKQTEYNMLISELFHLTVALD